MKIAHELGIYLHYIDKLNDLLGMYTLIGIKSGISF